MANVNDFLTLLVKSIYTTSGGVTYVRLNGEGPADSTPAKFMNDLLKQSFTDSGSVTAIRSTY